MAKKSDLVEVLAKSGGVSKAAAGRQMAALINAMTKSLKKGESVTVSGFGNFTVAKRSRRKGRNPQTGESIWISASKSARFKGAKALRGALNPRRKK